jgi:hypothetical protein
MLVQLPEICSRKATGSRGKPNMLAWYGKRDPEKWKPYMRDYMRGYRARQKEAKHAADKQG